MSLIETLSAVECEKLREERYNAQHPANYIFCENELIWMDPAGIAIPVVEITEPVVEIVAEPVTEIVVEPVAEAPVETPEAE